MDNLSTKTIGKNILLVCCGCDLSKRYIYEEVRNSLGINLYCLEEPNNRLATLLHNNKTWNHIPCPIFGTIEPSDPEYMKSIMNLINSECERLSITFDACVTIWDDAVCLMARISESLGLPGNSVDSIDVAHDKFLTRERLDEYGIPSPKHIMIKEDESSTENILEKVKNLSLPVIIKPASGGSSIGVRKVTDIDKIPIEYNHCLEIIKNSLTDGELMGINMGNTGATDILIEEFLNGTEVDVDLIIKNGVIVYSQVMDDWPPGDNWFCELGCNFPSRHEKPLRQAFIDAAHTIIKAIGLHTSVHHLEFINDSVKGPTLVECNPRMGGGPVHNFHKKAFGIDLMKEVILSGLGLDDDILKDSYPLEGPDYAMESCVTMVCYSHRSGYLNCDVETLLENCCKDTEVKLAAAQCFNGDYVTGWECDRFPTSIARIDYTSDILNIDECIQRLRKIKDQFLASIIWKND